jgi:putative glutamine amidotransferase
MIKKPIIGISLDWEDSPTYSSMHPWYALRCNYSSVISNNGGIPIIFPYEFSAIDKYIDLIDGLMIPGGDYDLDPSVYGEKASSKTRVIRNNRSDFETVLIKAALAKNIPVLGICAGEQLLAAIHGGTLLQDIKEAYPNALEHEQKHLNIHMSKTSHSINIMQNTLLHKIIGKDVIQVNSSHHQAVKSVGEEMIISAKAIDGVIEAVELINYDFALGVEWHPEYLASEDDLLIIKAFIKASSKND